jgi:transposase-like protein
MAYGRSWAGEVRNVSLLVATGVNERGYREILGCCSISAAACA